MSESNANFSTVADSLIVAAIVCAESLRKSDWSAGNEFAALQIAADKYYMGQVCGADAPLEVRRAIICKFLHNLPLGRDILRELKSGGGYFSFTYAGMLHGVEPDGYIHT